jgi:hypothetical protein
MIQNIDSLLTEIFDRNALHLYKWPEVNLYLVLFGQSEIGGVLICRPDLGNKDRTHLSLSGGDF